ncbi:Hypothetical protein SCF082_LOCUS29077 [Durusdinium trenchii]|uniref:Uncharacterized protein n=1 Tax=Durusdinium trenchii TaxID=1381693 RepID=A0ABP0MPF8_9DINO
MGHPRNGRELVQLPDEEGECDCTESFLGNPGPPPAPEYHYVGRGHGDFNQVNKMEFVGQGRGNYEVQHETHIDGYRVRWYWVIILGSLLAVVATAALTSILASLMDHRQSDAHQLGVDCHDAGHLQFWNPSQRALCCEKAHIGCPAQTKLFEHTGTAPVSPISAPTYDCDQGFENWQDAWTVRHQRYCCYLRQRACAVKIVHRDHYITVRREGDSSHGHFTHSYAGESGGPEDAHGSRDDLGQTYDCIAGLSAWQSGWSQSKKVWCCDHSFQESMRPLRNYCCRSLHIGCENYRRNPFRIL